MNDLPVNASPVNDAPDQAARRSPPDVEVRPDCGRHADPEAMAEIAARFGHYRIDLASWSVRWSLGIACILGRPMPASGVLSLDEHLACYHRDDAASIRLALSAATDGRYVERPYRSRGRVLRPDGTIRHVMAQGIGRSDGQGRLAATSGILVDITDTVEADRTARESDAMLRATLEAMNQGIIMVGSDRRIRVRNGRAGDLLGLPDHLMGPGTPFADVLRHQDASGEFDLLSEVERTLLPIWSGGDKPGAYTRRRPNGTVLEVHTSPLADGGFVRTYTDITERQAREAALLASEERYRLLAETTTDTVIWCHLDSTRRYVSPAARALFGFEPEELIGTGPLDFVHPDEAEPLASLLDDLARGRVEKATLTQRYRRKDGSFVWVEASFSLIRDPDGGAATGYVAALRDVSGRKAAEDALRLSEQRLAFALESGGDGLWSYDIERDLIVVSGRWLSILGYGEHEIAPTFAGWHAIAHPDDRDRIVQAVNDHLKGCTPAIEVEYRIRTKPGRYVWTLARAKAASHAPSGRPTLLIGTHMDITRRKEAEHTIAHLAHHDVLTSLPNRALFQERLMREIGAAERHGGGFAVLACDLDRFKAVNDALGHAAGDALLREIADRLKAVIRAEDTVARLGGDEFSVVLSRIAGREDAFAAARRVIEAVDRPIAIAGQRVAVGISVGLAFGPDDGRTLEDLCRRADLALYAAKASGRNTYRAYHAGLEAERAVRARLEDDLHEAVTRGGFLLGYQPIVSIGTGALRALEALLRWRHPTRGPISPSEFIPLVEQAGLMVRLGEWTLREACREAAAWRGSARVAVNISPAQFKRPGLERSVLSALAASGLDPSRLELAITDGVLMHDAEAAFASLARLRMIGVRLSLDDFGAGQASLRHLRRFPFDTIKLHHGLVRDLGSKAAAAMVRAIVELQAAAGGEVVAVGVETRTELACARAFGCTGAQGVLFSKPLAGEQAARLASLDRPVLAA